MTANQIDFSYDDENGRATDLKPTKEYKDSIIRALFKEPEKALKLYSDITGKVFEDNTVVEMKTLDNVLLSKRRNDIAFIINDILVVLIEHQSTLSMNMPLRALQYVLMFYEIYLKLGEALYREKRIMLPKPDFYMLYNGRKPYPSAGEMRLSDAFMGLAADEKPNLELIVKVININCGENPELMSKNVEINDYAIFVSKIESHQSKGDSLETSIKKSIDECLSEGIFVEFLTKYKDEVIAMFSMMYDEETALRIAREEALEDGIEKGIEKGIGISTLMMNDIKANIPSEKIAEQYNVSIMEVNRLRAFYETLIAG